MSPITFFSFQFLLESLFSWCFFTQQLFGNISNQLGMSIIHRPLMMKTCHVSPIICFSFPRVTHHNVSPNNVRLTHVLFPVFFSSPCFFLILPKAHSTAHQNSIRPADRAIITQNLISSGEQLFQRKMSKIMSKNYSPYFQLEAKFFIVLPIYLCFQMSF